MLSLREYGLLSCELVKGSEEAKAHMARLRELRKR